MEMGEMGPMSCMVSVLPSCWLDQRHCYNWRDAAWQGHVPGPQLMVSFRIERWNSVEYVGIYWKII